MSLISPGLYLQCTLKVSGICVFGWMCMCGGDQVLSEIITISISFSLWSWWVVAKLSWTRLLPRVTSLLWPRRGEDTASWWTGSVVSPNYSWTITARLSARLISLVISFLHVWSQQHLLWLAPTVLITSNRFSLFVFLNVVQVRELLSQKLSSWQQSCSQPTKLPERALNLLRHTAPQSSGAAGLAEVLRHTKLGASQPEQVR